MPALIQVKALACQGCNVIRVPKGDAVMCELFGLSSSRPVQAGSLLCRFGVRGGEAAYNPDGWGLAVLDDSAFRLTKEPIAAARSARFRALCLRTHSSLIIGHVRKANPPTALAFANTHPFRRDCCGHEWVFAHNGVIADAPALGGPGAAACCAQSGDTDSERAFCVVLDGIAAAFSAPGSRWFDALAGVAETLAAQGRFNFLLSDGVHLIAYGHDRLHSLSGARAALRLDAGVELAVIATEPLTEDPGWDAFEAGELRIYRAGQAIARFMTRPGAGAPVQIADRSLPIDIGVLP